MVLSGPAVWFRKGQIKTNTKKARSTVLTSVLCKSSFYIVENATSFVQEHPQTLWYMSQVLAARLFNASVFVVNIKRPYNKGKAIGTVEDILTRLLFREHPKILPVKKSPATE